MSYKISKELFEAVMSLKVIEFYCRNEIQYYPADKERVRCIDWIPTLSSCEYNDFFFKCKEWALVQDDILIMSGNNSPAGGNNKVCHILIREEKDWRAFMSDSEQQAVFNACQWILDNNDKQ